MFQSFRIAVRNITRQKKRSILLGGAVAFGFLVITLVNGFTSGVVATTKANFSDLFGGHIYITGSMVSDLGSEISVISDDAAAEAVTSMGERVKAVHYRSSARGTLFFGTREHSQKIDGVDFSDETDFRAGIDITTGSLADLDKPGVLILPEKSAEKLGVEIGDTVIFKALTITGQQNVTELTLIATTPSGGILPVDSAYTGKATLNALLGIEAGAFQRINVYLTDVEDTAAMTDELYSAVSAAASVEPRDGESRGGQMEMMKRMMGMGSLKSVSKADSWSGTKYAFSTIEDLMQPVLSLVSILDMISFGVFLVLLLIIGVGILNSYRMVMIERTAEIGTMRAIGVQKSGIREIFIVEAVSVSALGALTGFFLALTISAVLSVFDFGSTGFLSIFLAKGHFNFDVSLTEGVKNFLIICLMSLGAVYLPARTAANLEPAEALRATY